MFIIKPPKDLIFWRFFLCYSFFNNIWYIFCIIVHRGFCRKNKGEYPMKKGFYLFVMIFFLPLLFSCGDKIFDADFDSDKVGSLPATSPEGNPRFDSINLVGAPNSIEVINSRKLSSKAVKIDRGQSKLKTKFECITSGGPYCTGGYYIKFKAYPDDDPSGLLISVQSVAGYKALVMGYKNDRYSLVSGDGTEILPGTYPSGKIHSIYIKMSMCSRKFLVKIDDEIVASDKKFRDTNFQELHSLCFSYALTYKNFYGKYIVDDITIKQYLKCR